jgi:hypothetical protein
MHYLLSTVNSHALPSVNSICLLYIAGCGVRLSCYTTRETLQHSIRAVAIARTDYFLRAVAIACTDDLFGLYLVDLYFLLCHSSLELSSNQLQQLPPGVFSSLTSLRSLTCMVACIEN